MKKHLPWQLVLRNYRHTEDPQQKIKCRLWQASLGLQGVDGLSPSPYFVDLVEKHIQGKLSLSVLEEKLYRLYRWRKWDSALDRETWEADLCALHIAQLLSDKRFQFQPQELLNIHHRLFKDIYDFAGNFRDYDIRKHEWVLDGKSVRYLSCQQIESTLTRLFAQEKAYSYQGVSTREIISHLARFTSVLWLIHPYGEGNTRTTALFLIRYLRSLGIAMRIEVFVDSWYFRNALVRANYEDPENGIQRDDQYLKLFLRNLLLKENNPLRNQELHVNYPNI